MENHFLSVLDKHMPEMKVRARQKDAPYMTKEWKMAIREQILKGNMHNCLPKTELEKIGS